MLLFWESNQPTFSNKRQVQTNKTVWAGLKNGLHLSLRTNIQYVAEVEELSKAEFTHHADSSGIYLSFSPQCFPVLPVAVSKKAKKKKSMHNSLVTLVLLTSKAHVQVICYYMTVCLPGKGHHKIHSRVGSEIFPRTWTWVKTSFTWNKHGVGHYRLCNWCLRIPNLWNSHSLFTSELPQGRKSHNRFTAMNS